MKRIISKVIRSKRGGVKVRVTPGLYELASDVTKVKKEVAFVVFRVKEMK